MTQPTPATPAIHPDHKKLIMLIVGGQLQGLGSTLVSLDTNNTGTDDLVGSILKASGTVLFAAASDNLHGIRQGLMLNIQLSQQWLDDNPAKPV